MFKKKKSKSKAIRPELHEYSTLYWASTLATEPTVTLSYSFLPEQLINRYVIFIAF